MARCEACGQPLSLCQHLDLWIAQAQERLREAREGGRVSSIQAAQSALDELYAEKRRVGPMQAQA